MNESRLLAHDAGNEKRATLVERIWEIFGFGTQYAWILCIIYGSCAFKSVSSVEEVGWIKLIFIIGFVLAYLVLFCLRSRANALLSNRVAIIVAGAAGTLGTFLVIFPLSKPSGLVIAVAAVLVGLSSAVLMTGGNKVWSQLRSERVMIHLTTSAFVASVLYYVLLVLPDAISSVVICLLPVVGGVILSSTKKNKPRSRSFRRVDLIKSRTTTVRVLVFVASFSVTMGVMLGSSNAADSMAELAAISAVIMIGVLCASAGAFFCATRLLPVTMLTYFDRLGAPLMAIGCIIVLAVPDEFVPIGFAFIIAGFVLSDLFMWFLNAEMVFRSGRSSFEVLARSCLVEWVALMGGFLVTGFAEGLLAPVESAEMARWPFALCAILLMVVGNFVFTSVHAVRIIEAHEGARGEERLVGACGALAEQHGLSQRESEVMVFLANGRTVPYIKDRLTLSQSTVKTHVRSIYRKLEIDGKQSLIDLVEKVSERQR